MISIIVAMAKNRVIGKNCQLPWHLSSDLQRFKQLTMGHTLLMGRRTFESIGQPLPGRRTIVLSRDPKYLVAGCDMASDIESAIQLAHPAEELFICGGAEIYQQTRPLAERIYLTELDTKMEGDCYFPELPAGEFQTIYTEQCEDVMNYSFSILQRDNCNSPVSFIKNEEIMIKIDKAKTASFDVDPQRGFTPLCPDELPVSGGDQIADELNGQAEFAKVRLVSKDCHPAEAPWVAHSAAEIMQPVSGDYPNLDIKWPPHCVIGTEGNRLIPGLPNEADYDLVIEKGRNPLMHPYGACYQDLVETISTGAIEWLKEQRIDTILLGGLATDYCVKTTGLQLLRAGFRVIVNLAGCRGVAEETSQQAIEEMRSAGAEFIDSSKELVLI
ncbi:MAG: dihydrofolate reductase [Desulfuromusa sp.]|nr:dihydrofolate reductase [Desulfuromusa sp.]